MGMGPCAGLSLTSEMMSLVVCDQVSVLLALAPGSCGE